MLITYFSKRRCFSILLSFDEALIYMLSSITKKGEIESTSAPWVILVINVNISLVGLILLPSIFQMSLTLEWQDKRMWNPFKMLRTNIGKCSRLYIFILVIQDHIESIGKPILLKGDEVLLNGLLAQSA